MWLEMSTQIEGYLKKELSFGEKTVPLHEVRPIKLRLRLTRIAFLSGYSFRQQSYGWYCCWWRTYRQAHAKGWPCLPQIQGQAQLLAQGSWCGYEPR